MESNLEGIEGRHLRHQINSMLQSGGTVSGVVVKAGQICVKVDSMQVSPLSACLRPSLSWRGCLQLRANLDLLPQIVRRLTLAHNRAVARRGTDWDLHAIPLSCLNNQLHV